MIKRVDENGNVRLITNVRKPRKWRRYEYLLSSGTLYIDTEYIPKGNFGTEVKFQLTRVNSFQTIWGSMPSSNQPNPRTGFHNYLQGLWMAGINNTSSFGTTDTNSVHTLKQTFNNGTETMALDETSVYTFSPGSTALSSNILSIYLFARNLNPISNYTAMKCYYFKVYENDTLVRDFVPAQYNGQYGMWDLVEDKFYPNKGTGSFTVGPEMKNYDEIYEVKKAYSILPSGVELYDYILSSGTLYIDTGWITDYTKSFEITSKYNASSSGTRGCILSSYNASRATSLEVTTYSRFWLHDGNMDNIIAASVGVDHTSIFSYGGGTWKHQVDNGTAQTGSASYSDSATGSAYMFLDRALRTTTFNKTFKMYYLSIKENGVLIRNFIPCTYLGEPGMWDTVENKFYRNQGTGQFTLGNKITLKEYEYLLSNASGWINTNYIPTFNTSVKTKVNTVSNSAASFAFGSRIGAGSLAYYVYYQSDRWYYSANSSSNTITQESSRLAEIEYSIPVVKINTYTLNTNLTTFTSTKPIYLFGVNTNGSMDNQRGNVLIYYFKIYENNQLVRDLIPCSYNGTPGLWDKVEWKFYANTGSGNFTLGPEKASGSIYLHDHLTNLFDGFVGGGQMTLSNGILVGTGNNSDTYFKTKTTQAVNTTSYYLVGVYVEGYTSATAWTFCSPQSNNNATLKITRDGWNWGYVKFGNANSQPIWDDSNRTFSGSIPKITISDCRIYKIT